MRVFISIFAGFMVAILTCVSNVHASRIAPLSQYGQIPNVQTYSSNPLWNPNGPYNQTFPRPVYVDGPDLNSGDCERTVSALVASFCTTNNNCYGMQLSDIRPSIMLQLSRLPGHNWAMQCMGYIDNAFSEYQSTAQNHVPTTPVSFPQGTVPSNTQGAEFKIKNPFAPQIPDWAKEMQERKQELKQLQSQTSNYDTSVSYSSFPQTYYDLSFSERMDNETNGYEPYKDAKVYEQITVEKAKEVPISKVVTPKQQKTEPEVKPVPKPIEQPVEPVADEEVLSVEIVIPVDDGSAGVNCVSDRESKLFSAAEDDALKQCLAVLRDEISRIESFDEANCCTFNANGVCSAKVEMWQAELEASTIVQNVLLNNSDCQSAKSEIEKYIWCNHYFYPSDNVLRYVSMFAIKAEFDANRYTVFLKYCFDTRDDTEYDKMLCHFSH